MATTWLLGGEVCIYTRCDSKNYNVGYSRCAPVTCRCKKRLCTSPKQRAYPAIWHNLSPPLTVQCVESIVLDDTIAAQAPSKFENLRVVSCTRGLKNPDQLLPGGQALSPVIRYAATRQIRIAAAGFRKPSNIEFSFFREASNSRRIR